MVTPLRELAYLPKGVLDPHGLPPGSQRASLRPEEIAEQLESNPEEAAKK
jgi:NAD(P)H-quinone oxidoreductase subunit I